MGHAEHCGLGDAGVREQLLLDVARVHVRTAGDVHVRGAAGDVEVAVGVDHPEVAGVEPAVGERVGVRLGVVEVAVADGRAGGADLPGLARGDLTPLGVEDDELHAGADAPAGAELDALRARTAVLVGLGGR